MQIYKKWQWPLLLTLMALLPYFNFFFKNSTPKQMAKKVLSDQAYPIEKDQAPLLLTEGSVEILEKQSREEPYKSSTPAILALSEELQLQKEQSFIKRLEEIRKKRLRFEENAPCP